MVLEGGSLQSRVHEHRLFFDDLVELIPPNFYIPREEEHENNSWYGINKDKRALVKQATRERLKQAKCDRLDPNKRMSTVKLIELKETEKLESPSGMNEEGQKAQLRGSNTRASTYEELRERLYKRIKMLQEGRNADAAASSRNSARKWKMEKKQNSQRQTRKKSDIKCNVEADLHLTSKRRKQINGQKNALSLNVHSTESNSLFEFGKVKMGLQINEIRRKRKQKKVTKELLLEKAAKLEREMQDPQKGQEVSSAHAWSAAVRRASGEKVFDDSRLLKQSIKREKQQREKSFKKWMEKKEAVEQMVEAKQQARSEHIKERKRQKKERKIAKHEKKFLRPGFEGRRDSFINA